LSSLPERLRQLRKLHDRSQEDLAEYLGISKSGYGYYEQGRNEPSLATIKKLARYYNVSIDYITGEEENEAEKIYESDSFSLSFKNGGDFSPGSKEKIIDFIKMIEEIEKGRKPKKKD